MTAPDCGPELFPCLGNINQNTSRRLKLKIMVVAVSDKQQAKPAEEGRSQLRRSRKCFLAAGLVSRRNVGYDQKDERAEGRESLVTELIEKFRRVQLPPHQEKAMGLQPNWKDTVTKEFAEKVFDAAQKHRDAIKELEKH